MLTGSLQSRAQRQQTGRLRSGSSRSRRPSQGCRVWKYESGQNGSGRPPCSGRLCPTQFAAGLREPTCTSAKPAALFPAPDCGLTKPAVPPSTTNSAPLRQRRRLLAVRAGRAQAVVKEGALGRVKELQASLPCMGWVWSIRHDARSLLWRARQCQRGCATLALSIISLAAGGPAPSNKLMSPASLPCPKTSAVLCS